MDSMSAHAALSGRRLVLLMVCLTTLVISGCGNVAVPDIAVVGPSPAPAFNSEAIVATVSVAYALPVPSDPNHSEVWLAAMARNMYEAARYEWDFGDGSPVASTYNDPGVKHLYPVRGVWTIGLKVYSNNGRTATATTRLVLP